MSRPRPSAPYRIRSTVQRQGGPGSRGSRTLSPAAISAWARLRFHEIRKAERLSGRGVAVLLGLSTGAHRGNAWPLQPGPALLALLRALGRESRRLLPATRGECPRSRPCPFVSCRNHLYLDLGARGAIKLNFPDLEVWELPETCSHDVAARCGATLEEVGDAMNLTRERVRQLELRALAKIKETGEPERLRGYVKE